MLCISSWDFVFVLKFVVQSMINREVNYNTMNCTEKGDVDVRVYIFAAMALGRGRVVSPMFGHLYP